MYPNDRGNQIMSMHSSTSIPATARDKYRALLSSATKTAGSDNVRDHTRIRYGYDQTPDPSCAHHVFFPFLQWKTSAGRLDGPDNFVLGDAWRCLKLQFKRNTKPSGVCPVCLEKPGSESDWYVTKSCKHAVCRVREFIVVSFPSVLSSTS